MPWHLGAFGHVVDAQAHAVEDDCERQAAFAHHLGQCLGVGTIGALTRRGDRAGGRVEGDQHARLRLHQRQTAGKQLAGTRERTCPGTVKNEDIGLQIQCGEGAGVIGNP